MCRKGIKTKVTVHMVSLGDYFAALEESVCIGLQPEMYVSWRVRLTSISVLVSAISCEWA